MIAGSKAAVRDRILPIAARVSARPSHGGLRRVLILQPDHLGDILLSQPAVTMLRRVLPDDELIGVVGPWSRDIAKLAWPVDRFVEVEFPSFTRGQRSSPLAPYALLRRATASLAAFEARAAVVLRPDGWWATWLASRVAPVVISSNDSRCLPFATLAAAVPDDTHAAIRAWSIAATFRHERPLHLPTWLSDPLRIPESPTSIYRVWATLQQHHISGQYIVVHPGAGAAVKEWLPHRWSLVARAAAERGLQVVVTGSAAERPLADAVASAVSTAAVLAGQTSVAELAELLRGAKAVVGPDCGPLHLAVAVGTPTVHLFGPSNSTRYGPWGDPRQHRIVRAGWNCPRCGDLSPSRTAGCGCMLAINADDVIAALDDVLAKSHAP